MKYKIFIDGEAGTTGLEIKKRLTDQNEVEILSIKDNLRKDTAERLRLYEKSDITFMCLPDEESKVMVAKANPHMKIIDASTTHRVKNGWIYGLPELGGDQKEKIQNSNRVANPGCHATGFVLLMRPLIDSGIIHKDIPLFVHSVTGYSGGGKSMIAKYEKTNALELDSPGQYGLSQSHKHLPEMTKYGGINLNPVFIPIVGNFYRGMLINIPLHKVMLQNKTTPGDLYDVYKKRYLGHQCIEVSYGKDNAPASFIHADALKDRDDFKIVVCGNNERITLTAVYDNLGKGASGAAIQNMNIMLGRPEYKGLNFNNEETRI